MTGESETDHGILSDGEVFMMDGEEISAGTDSTEESEPLHGMVSGTEPGTDQLLPHQLLKEPGVELGMEPGTDQSLPHQLLPLQLLTELGTELGPHQLLREDGVDSLLQLSTELGTEPGTDQLLQEHGKPHTSVELGTELGTDQS